MTVLLIPKIREGPDGSFPQELARTKPYGYSLFNLDAMAIIAQTLGVVEVAVDAGWAGHGEGHGIYVSVHAG